MEDHALAHMLVVEVEQARTLLRAGHDGSTASWKAVLEHAGFWCVRHEGELHSTVHMSDEGLQQAVVEDVLFATVERARGAAGTYPRRQALKHVGGLSHRERVRESERIVRAVEDAIASGLVDLNCDDGSLSIPAFKMEEAQNYCGVFHWSPEEAEAPDVFDSIKAAGGLELVTDTFEELAFALGKLDPPTSSRQ